MDIYHQVTRRRSHIHGGPNNVLENGDRVTVIWPRSVTGFNKELIMDGTSFSTIYSSSAFPTEFSPAAATTRFVIYGVDPGLPISVGLLTGQIIIFNGRPQCLKPVLLTQVYFTKPRSIKAMEAAV